MESNSFVRYKFDWLDHYLIDDDRWWYIPNPVILNVEYQPVWQSDRKLLFAI